MFKKKTLTKPSSIVLVILLLLALLPSPAFGAELNYLVSPSLELESAGLFYDGLAPVKVKGKYGYMNTSGELVIEAKYDLANNFNEGKAIVATGTENNYTVGIVDTSGKYTAISVKLEDDEQKLQPSGCRFNDGYVYIPVLPHYGGGTGILVDGSGSRVLSDYDLLSSYTDGLIHSGMALIASNYQQYIDINGRIMMSDDSYDKGPTGEWRVFNSYNFQDGLAAANGYKDGSLNSEDTKIGFIDKTGKFVIEPQYENFYVRYSLSSYEVFNDGIASVLNSSGKWGGIDKAGKVVVPFEYDDGFLFSEGYARVKVGNKYGFVDTSGNLAIPAVYDSADDGFYQGVAWVGQNGKEGYINTAGDVVIPLEYDGVFRFVGGAAFIRTNDGKYGIAGVPSGVPSIDTPSDWAAEDMEAAEKAGLITDSVKNLYRTNINRYQFADIVVNMVETATGETISPAPRSTFSDTSEIPVLKGYAAGILSGTSADKFTPGQEITREEMASMLYRAITYMEDVMDATYVDDNSDLTKYSDRNQVSSWAQEAVGILASNGIMAGTSNTTLSPKSQATVEQSCVLIYRIFSDIVE